MLRIKINNTEYDCHSYNEKDIAVGHSVEMILEGKFKPQSSDLIQIEKCGIKFNAELVKFYNYDYLSKVIIFKGENDGNINL